MNEQLNHYRAKLAFETDPSDLFHAMSRGENVTPLDARERFGYATEHIPGAINIPHPEMNEETTAHLDRNVLYVIYCDGVGCNASTKGALNMTKLGFNVKELIGGIEWWKSDGYATEGAEAYAAGQKIKCAC